MQAPVLPRRLGALAAALVLMLAACGGATEAAAEPEVEAEPTPVPALLSGTFDTLAGTSIDLASLEGQDVVLWFWAPW